METRGFQGRANWARWYRRAHRKVSDRLRQEGVLLPPQVAETVVSVLPAAWGRWLLYRLRSLGWLGAGARIPFDVFESAACPPEFRGPVGALARLAVFGPAGEGRPDFKHREAAYQHICAQIMREASDLPTLSGAASRALSHPDVCGDPNLASMVRSFIAEREAAFRTERRVEKPEPEDDSQLRKAFEEVGTHEFPTRMQVGTAFLRYQREFETHLAQYNQEAAGYALEKLQELARRCPVHVDVTVVRRYEQQFAEFIQRCEVFRHQIEDVAGQAAEAARRGDEATASWLIRRLRAIHALTPVLLPAERFEKLREEIEQCGSQFEQRQALRALMAREREVAGEIKKAGAAIYRFHKVAKTTSPESEEYKRAERVYREAVVRVRVRDTEWLTGLLLELEAYLEDLHDPSGRAQAQLDRFIGTVRTALNQLRLEIRATQEERAAHEKARGVPPPATGSDGAAAAPPT